MQSKKIIPQKYNFFFFLFWNVLLIKWNVFYYNHSFDKVLLKCINILISYL